MEIDTGEKRGPGRPRKSMELDTRQIAQETADEQRRAAALHQPLYDNVMSRRLSDDEIMERGSTEEGNVLHIPHEIIPEGMVYQWFVAEVYGAPHIHKEVLKAQRNGWRSVPASRHPGMWSSGGDDEPIIVNGLHLMELPDAEAYNRARYFYLRARNAVREGNQRLHQAPAGTGPRTHPGVRPQVNVARESLPVE